MKQKTSHDAKKILKPIAAWFTQPIKKGKKMCIMYIYMDEAKEYKSKNLRLKGWAKTNMYSKWIQSLKRAANPTVRKKAYWKKKKVWLSLLSPWQSAGEESQILCYGL